MGYTITVASLYTLALYWICLKHHEITYLNAIAVAVSADDDKDFEEGSCSPSSSHVEEFVGSADDKQTSNEEKDLQELTRIEEKEDESWWKKTLTSEEKEKAVEMGLRIGLIEDDETEKLYGPLLAVSNV